jgi:transmembrane sensor
MSTDHPYPSDESLDEAATEWLCEREEGFSPERAHAFAAWRGQDPRHEAAVQRVEEMLSLLDELPKVRAPLEDRLLEEQPAQANGARLIRLPGYALIAGLAAALVVGWFVWSESPMPAPEPLRYATDQAAGRRLALNDGSLVDLNAGSEVQVTFSTGERRITLSTGEAHFDVAHDADRPFVVTAGGVSVRAVGTAFNVKLAGDSIDVLVVEGKVEVQREDQPQTQQRPLVAAGEQARMRRDDPVRPPTVEKVTDAAIREQLAWQTRMIPFIDLPLRDLVTQFNRRNATQLVLGDPALGERRVGGMIALDQLDAFVRLLEQDGDIVVERRTSDAIVLRQVR